MKRFLFLLLLLTSCTRTLTTTQQSAQSTHTIIRDTLTRHDTLHLTRRDTLTHRDTILLKTYPSADTIIRQLIIHRQAVRLLHDTIRLAAHQSAAHDTLTQSSQTLTHTATAPRPSLLHRIALIAWLLVILTLIYLFIKDREK